MKNIWLQSLIITLFVFFSLFVVNKVTDLKMFSAFDVISTALKDFELTDYAFSYLRDPPDADPRIVLVNIGRLSRGELGQQISMISQYKPKVIGIDVLFRCEGGLRDTINCPQLLDTLGNLMLSSAIQEAGNVVLGSKLMQTTATSKIDSEIADSVEYSDAIFQMYAQDGFVSLPTEAKNQEDVKICKTVWPRMTVEGKERLAFSTKLAMIYDSVKTKKYLARNIPEEIINFRGNIEVQTFKTNSLKNADASSALFNNSFYAIDVEQLQRGEVLPELFRNSIVIMGFLGDQFGDPSWEDKFYSPLNRKVAGRANPDMFGVVVHANIIAMILNEDYVSQLPAWSLYLIAFISCLLTVALLIYIDHKLPSWFDALSFFVQIILLIAVSLIVVMAFAKASIKLDLTLTIGVTALVGPCYDIFKSLQNEYNKRFTKKSSVVLKE